MLAKHSLHCMNLNNFAHNAPQKSEGWAVPQNMESIRSLDMSHGKSVEQMPTMKDEGATCALLHTQFLMHIMEAYVWMEHGSHEPTEVVCCTPRLRAAKA